jgi:hypothetical protein
MKIGARGRPTRVTEVGPFQLMRGMHHLVPEGGVGVEFAAAVPLAVLSLHVGPYGKRTPASAKFTAAGRNV